MDGRRTALLVVLPKITLPKMLVPLTGRGEEMQLDSFKFVYVVVKQKTDKAARVQVMNAPFPSIEVWLPFSQCSPNLQEAPRGQFFTVGVRDWLVPNKGLMNYLMKGPATVFPPKPASPWEDFATKTLVPVPVGPVAVKFVPPAVAAKPQPIDWEAMMKPSVTEQEAVKAEFHYDKVRNPDPVVPIFAQPIAPESSQEPDEESDFEALLNELL